MWRPNEEIHNPIRQNAIDCEFCFELMAPEQSRFNALYGKFVQSRIIVENDSFAVLPTIGQLFKGSLLVIPKLHFERIADIPMRDIQALIGLVGELEDVLKTSGKPILFEHGARCTSNSGCGIYHAHLHIVPLPLGSELYCGSLLPQSRVAEDLCAAFSVLKDSTSYLLVRDTMNNVAFAKDEMLTPEMHVSQFVRRRLTQMFASDNNWDWRSYLQVEPWVLDTLNVLKTHDFSFGK